jgi:D-alanyl-D-alanine dipeptidase
LSNFKKVIFALTAVVVLVVSAVSTEKICGFINKNPVSSSSSAVSVAVSSAQAMSESSSAASPKIIDGFVQLKDLDPDFVFDLKYATTDNFTHQKVYPNAICTLRVATAQKLVKANAEFKKRGYRIKIWDAYRPLSVQKIFWSIEPNDNYVADPYNGASIHNRGCAVDITLVDSSGKELEMPSGFDNFTQSAYRSNQNMSSTARTNMNMLTDVMTQSGFITIDTEWWHFEDSDWQSYPIADVDLTRFQ